MIAPPTGFKLSQQERDRLITLKRYTGIKNWNTLCRWAFCLSLAEPSPPPRSDLPSDSNVEMTWQTFGGPNAPVLWALLLQRCRRDGVAPWEPRELALQFRLHLHRGIGYLAGNRSVRGITELVRLAVEHHGDTESETADTAVV